MSKEKQIEEMAIIISHSIQKWANDLPPISCPAYNAENLYAAGFRKQSEWISVEERLPDMCGMDVLMVAVNCYGQTNIVKGFTDYQCPIKFLTNEKQYDNIWGAWEVTHWMPLPEAPKGGAG